MTADVWKAPYHSLAVRAEELAGQLVRTRSYLAFTLDVIDTYELEVHDPEVQAHLDVARSAAAGGDIT